MFTKSSPTCSRLPVTAQNISESRLTGLYPSHIYRKHHICLQRHYPLQMPVEIFIMHCRVPWSFCLTSAAFPKWEKNENSIFYYYYYESPVICSMVVPYTPVLILWDKHKNCRGQIHYMFWRSWKGSELPASMDIEKSCLILSMRQYHVRQLYNSSMHRTLLSLHSLSAHWLPFFITICFIFTFIENFGLDNSYLLGVGKTAKCQVLY